MSTNSINNSSFLWDQFLCQIQGNIPDSHYQIISNDVVPLEISNNILTLNVSNNLVREWLEDRYYEPVLWKLQSIMGNEDLVLQLVTRIEEKESDSEKTLNLPVNTIKPIEESRESAKKDLSNNQGNNQGDDFLNPKYTFNSFVDGKSNEFAHAMALAVAKSPGTEYNPLFIYGGVGLGKTHLMQAIGHYIRNNNRQKRIVFVSAETFLNGLVLAIKEKKNKEFRAYYRACDVLLIDDIQFIAGKEQTQEEFFHTFNTLFQQSKQIVLSSDRPPAKIDRLEDRLVSRFEHGVIADIQSPDLELRMAILSREANFRKIDVSNEVINYIAQKIESNIRQLQGAFLRIVAYSQLHRIKVNLDLVDDVLKDMKEGKAQKVNIEKITEAVGNYFNITVEELKSKRRNQKIAYPRQIAMYLCCTETQDSLQRIGEEFGGRDHTTVLHGREKISGLLQTDPRLREDIRIIVEKNLR